MRFCLRAIVSLLLLTPFAMSQAPEPTAPPTAPSAPPIQLTPDVSGSVPQEQIRDLLRYAQEKEFDNEKKLRDYTYVEREEEHKLDGNGQLKKIETRTWDILEIYGEEVDRLTAKDDKPLPEKEAKKEEEKVQKVIDKRKDESEHDRRKRLEKEEKDREEDRKYILEIADAYNFRLVGSELVDGRDAWVIEAEPRPGFEPKDHASKLLTKVKGRVWIDKAEGQWIKLDLSVIDTISVGWFLARIHQGAHLEAEQTKVNDEVWLPKHVAVRVDLRLALVKDYHDDIDITFRDYKKFRTATKITLVGEQ